MKPTMTRPFIPRKAPRSLRRLCGRAVRVFRRQARRMGCRLQLRNVHDPRSPVRWID